MPDETIFTPHERHPIAGEWVAGDTTFQNEPVTGPAHDFSVRTPDLVNRACAAAEKAFRRDGYSTRQERAAFLNAVADEIEARVEAITAIGSRESGLPQARLQDESGRTTGQRRLFAEHILKGDDLDRCHEKTLPDRNPCPVVAAGARDGRFDQRTGLGGLNSSMAKPPDFRSVALKSV